MISPNNEADEDDYNDEEEDEYEGQPYEDLKEQGAVVDDIVSGVTCDNPNFQLLSTRRLRYLSQSRQRFSSELMGLLLLDRERVKPTDFLKYVIPRVVEFLSYYDRPDLQYEAARSLNNIVCGPTDHIELVFRAEAIPPLTKLIESPKEKLREQAVYAVSNIAATGEELRDHVIAAGAVEAFIRLAESDIPKSMGADSDRHIALLLSSITRCIQPLQKDLTSRLLSVISSLLSSNDGNVLQDTCWAIINIMGEETDFEQVVEDGILSRLIEIARRKGEITYYNKAIAAVVQLLGDLAASEDSKGTQAILDVGCLQFLQSLLSTEDVSLLTTVLVSLSNIASGTHEQIQALVDSGIVLKVSEIFGKADELGDEVITETVYVVANVASSGTDDQILYLIKSDVIKTLCSSGLIGSEDAAIVSLVLTILKQALEAALTRSMVDTVSAVIKEHGCLDRIRSVQDSDDGDAATAAKRIIEILNK